MRLLHSIRHKTLNINTLIISVIVVVFILSISTTILAACAIFKTPSIVAGSLYTIELNFTNINMSKFFADTELASYNFSDTGLSSIYRFGVFGYCGGSIKYDKFIVDHCVKKKSYPIGPMRILLDEFLVNANSTGEPEVEDIRHPLKFPSEKSITSMSKKLCSASLTGFVTSIMTTFFLLLSVVVMTVRPAAGCACFIVVIMALGGTTGWSFISVITGGRSLVKEMAKDLNSSDFGVKAKVGKQFFALMFGAMGTSVIFVATSFSVLYGDGGDS